MLSAPCPLPPNDYKLHEGRLLPLLKFILFVYLLWTALGLHCYVWAFSSCVERGLLFIAELGF